MRTFRFVITWIIINLIYDFLYSLGGSFLCCLVEIIGLFICAVISIPWLKVVLISAGLLMIDLLLMFSGFSGFEVLHRCIFFAGCIAIYLYDNALAEKKLQESVQHIKTQLQAKRAKQNIKIQSNTKYKTIRQNKPLRRGEVPTGTGNQKTGIQSLKKGS